MSWWDFRTSLLQAPVDMDYSAYLMDIWRAGLGLGIAVGCYEADSQQTGSSHNSPVSLWCPWFDFCASIFRSWRVMMRWRR